FGATTPTQSFPTPTSPGVASGSGETRGAPQARASYATGKTREFFSSLCGRSVGKYQVEELLGTGGMGAVFRARDKLLGREVALKVVHPHLAGQEEIRRRFLREARAALEFTHPNAVATRDCDVTPDGLLYMTQDYCPGESLRKLLMREGRLPVPRALGIARQILLALTEAHRKKIVHRDLKPENVIVGRDAEGHDLVKVCDFGIAKILESSADDGTAAESLTAVGQVLGTPHYMAPEQAEGLDVDGRADIYAVGCVLYEMLAGGKPFEAKTLRQIVLMHMGKPPEPFAERCPEAEVPAAVEAVVRRAMEKEADERFPSAGDFVAAIDALGYELPGVRTLVTKLQSQVAPPAVPPRAADHETTVPPQRGPRKEIRPGVVLALAALVVALSFGGVYMTLRERRRERRREQRIAAQRAAEEARRAKEREEAARRAAAAKAEQERLAKERAEAERQAREAQRRAREAEAERERLARERAEAERRAAEAKAAAERERRARERAEAARRAAEAKAAAERERRARERAEAARRAAEAEKLLVHSARGQRLALKGVPAQRVGDERVGPLLVTRKAVSYGLFASWIDAMTEPRDRARRVKSVPAFLAAVRGRKGANFFARVPPALRARPLKGIPPHRARELARWLGLRLPTEVEAQAIVRSLELPSSHWVVTRNALYAVTYRKGRGPALVKNPPPDDLVVYLVK
ncbi:MAG: serine/threonine protein kinase, partial [Planctomycetota bacterium]